MLVGARSSQAEAGAASDIAAPPRAETNSRTTSPAPTAFGTPNLDSRRTGGMSNWRNSTASAMGMNNAAAT